MQDLSMQQQALAPFRDQVVVAESLSKAGIDTLEQQFEVLDLAGAPRQQLMQSLAEAAALVVRSATQVDAELLEAAPRLRNWPGGHRRRQH